MEHLEPLKHGNFYHIFNRGINSCPLFKETTNYEHFLRLYTRHISPVADTYAWVLMKNHFHFLVRIKTVEEIAQGNSPRIAKIVPHQSFSNLFNAYTKALNKKLNRTGGLFESRFRRKRVWELNYFKQLVVYIHKNPVHHNIVANTIEYPWSSYLSSISLKDPKIQLYPVSVWFNDEGEFMTLHNEIHDFGNLENWLGLTK